MAGDTNIVEDPIDRFPVRKDPDGPTSALDDLKRELQLVDGWRETYPTKISYTYLQKATGSQSRIDRIYTRREMLNNTFNWNITAVGIPTDHNLISVTVENHDAPETGEGVWTWPRHMYSDKILNEHSDQLGMTMHEEMLT
ncbi:hypothetical protein V5O48_019409, partial [Marasmius crinis-equi]